jgi:hypothetical protein
MHGLSPGNQKGLTTSASLPVYSLPAETQLNAPQPVFAISDWDRYLEAAFRSPATRACFQTPHFEVNVPGLPLRHLIRPSPNPLRPDAPECPTCFRSPLGVLMPLRIKAFSGFSPLEVHLRNPLDFPSLPVARLHIMKTATDQCSGFATFCEVRCFREPLGTGPSCFKVK